MAMRRGSTLLIVLLGGGLSGCGTAASRDAAAAADSQAAAERAEAKREHAQLIAIETRLMEMERLLATQSRACDQTPDTRAGSVPLEKDRPLRSDGDFLAEARVVVPAPLPDTRVVRGDAPKPATAASERERMEQQLEGLRHYASDPRSGLSLERRQALRILLQRERQLDLMNPWADR